MTRNFGPSAVRLGLRQLNFYFNYITEQQFSFASRRFTFYLISSSLAHRRVKVMVQTLFISDSSRWRVSTAEQDRDKPGRYASRLSHPCELINI